MKNKKIWLLLSLGCILSGIFFLFAGTLLGGIPGFYVRSGGSEKECVSGYGRTGRI